MRKLIIFLSVLIFSSAAYWVIDGSSRFAKAAFVGTYIGINKSTSMDIVRLIEVREDGTIKITSDLKERGLIIDSGVWSAVGSVMAVNIKYSSSALRPIPMDLEFTKSRSGITGISYDENVYGRNGLELYRFWPSDLAKTNARLSEARNTNLTTNIAIGLYLKGSWNLSSMIKDELRTIPNSPSSISFDGQKISGSICNNFSGGYVYGDGFVETNDVVATKKACPEPDMGIENEFFKGLNEGMSVVFDANNNLFLFSKNGYGFNLIRK